MHEILTSHPAIVDLDRQVDELKQAEAKYRQRVEAVMQPYRERMGAWEFDTDQAILEGREPEPQPPAPDLGADQRAPHLFLQRRSQLQAERGEVLAQICFEVEAAAGDRECQLLAAAKDLVDRLEVIAAEHDRLLHAVREVRSAADASGDERPVPSRSSRMRSHIGVSELVDLLQAGGSAFDLAAPPGLPLPTGHGDEPEPAPREPVPRRGRTL